MTDASLAVPDGLILLHMEQDFAAESVPLALATREILERYSHAKHVRLLDVWNLFLNARLNRVFEIYDTEENALRSFRKE